jgi:hypothetical protein
VPRVVTRSEARRWATHWRIRPTLHPTRLVCSLRVWFAVLAWASVAGCSATDVAVSPPIAKCQVAVDNSLPTAAAAGGAGTLTVTTTPECTWDASTATPWVTITAPSHGQGNGAVTYRVATNGEAVARHGTLSVNGTQVSITQDAASCGYIVTPVAPSIGAGGGTVELQVETAGACRWNAAPQVNWIQVAGSPGTSGSGRVTLTIDANGGASRSGSVVIADQTLTVRQAGQVDPSCAFQVTPLTISVPAEGGTAPIAVTTTAGCVWDVTSNATWITIPGNPAAAGSGTVPLAFAANAGAARTGIVMVAGQAVTVTQAAASGPACTFAVAPTTASVPAEGGALSVRVTTTSPCVWQVSASASWIVVASAPTTTGSGTVQLSVAANDGAGRSATLTVAGQAVTITQAAASIPCAFSIAPLEVTIVASGGSRSVSVTAPNGCGWSASKNAPWLTIVSGASGIGNGTVTVAAGANTATNPRSDTVMVAGQVVTVTQAAAATDCSFGVTPLQIQVAAAGGSGSVTVTAPSGCAWSASKNASWLTILSGASGTGAGTVTIAASANTATNPRSDTVMVAGQAVTVTQAAVVTQCSFGVTPPQIAVPVAGGNATVTVTAPTGCAWTASKNASWVTIVSGVSGAGNGTVVLAVSATNASSPRSDTLTVAGEAVTITQPGAAACEYSISPSSATVDKSGTTITVNVVTGSGCAWTAQAHADWLSIVVGVSGSGSGVARVEVEKLAGAPRDRVGTVTIAGKTLTVTQVK